MNEDGIGEPLNTEDWIQFKKLQFWSIIESFQIDHKSQRSILVIDKKLAGIFSLIFTVDQIKEHGIENLCYFDDQQLPPSDFNNIIYLVKPRLEVITILSNQLKKLQSQSNPITYYLIAIPKLEYSFQYLLEREALIGLFKIHSYDIGFIPYDHDFLSLELTDFFSKSFIENDNYQIESIAKSLIQLQQLYGPFQGIIGKGSKSKMITEYLLPSQDLIPPFEYSKLKNLILIDRNLDLIPMLLTQQTYQGLVDEILTISSSSSIILDDDENYNNNNNNNNNNTMNNSQSIGKRKVFLDSKDILFSNIKNFNFSLVPGLLHNNALLLNNDYQSVKLTNNTSIPDLKRLVSRIPTLQLQKDAILLHTTISERLMKSVKDDDFQNKVQYEFECLFSTTTESSNKSYEFIQDMIIRKKPMYQILRLIAIYCLTIGMSAKSYQNIIKDFIHVYEHDSIPILLRLEKAGIIGPKESLPNYQNHNILKKSFKLTNNLFDSNNNPISVSQQQQQQQPPEDNSYSGYIPAITRIIEKSTKEWKSVESKLSSITNSPTFNINIPKTAQTNDRSLNVVFFVGGVTYSELSSLRHLKSIYGKGSGYDFLFLSTNVTNGTNFLMNI